MNECAIHIILIYRRLTKTHLHANIIYLMGSEKKQLLFSELKHTVNYQRII